MGTAKLAGMIALASAMAAMFKPQWSPFTAPVYALCKGVALAGLSAVLEVRYPGIALNAVVLTFSVAASLLTALKTRMVRVTDRFRDSVMAVTGGYFVSMMLLWLLSMFGLRLPGLFAAGRLKVWLGHQVQQ